MAHRIAEVLPELPELRVLARGSAMVPDYGALANPAGAMRRFHGRRLRRDVGPTFKDEKGEVRHHGGFEKVVDHVVTIAPNSEHYAEYIRHLRDGDLWAADQVTADAAGVLFEPDFGGEHPGHASLKEHAELLKKRAETEKEHVAAAKKLEAERAAAAKVAAEKPATPADGTRVPSETSK